MSETTTTPPAALPRPPALAVAINRLADGQDALGDALGELARTAATREALEEVEEKLDKLATDVEGAIRGFGDSHGHRAAAERHAMGQLELILGEMRTIAKRMTVLEEDVGTIKGHVTTLASRLAGAELAIDEVRESNGARNGSGSDAE